MMPTEQEVVELVETIWETTLDMPLARAATRRPPALPLLEAQVHLTGTWRGAVVLQASLAVAGRIATRLFQSAEVPPAEEDVLDAFGEVANMVGGNFKGLVSTGDASLSLPIAAIGYEYRVRIPRSNCSMCIELACGDEPVIVSIFTAWDA